MKLLETDLLPASRLAVVYARRDLRDGLTLLLAFDERLAELVQRASEPIFAQMKIAWWNDAMKCDSAARPKGEPVFEALRNLDLPGLEIAMQRLLDSWDSLLAADDWSNDVLQSFAEARSSAVFATYADWISSDLDVSEMGQFWALADLQQRFGARVAERPLPAKRVKRFGRALRPLSILAKSVGQPTPLSMLWHALTGR